MQNAAEILQFLRGLFSGKRKCARKKLTIMISKSLFGKSYKQSAQAYAQSDFPLYLKEKSPCSPVMLPHKWSSFFRESSHLVYITLLRCTFFSAVFCQKSAGRDRAACTHFFIKFVRPPWTSSHRHSGSGRQDFLPKIRSIPAHRSSRHCRRRGTAAAYTAAHRGARRAPSALRESRCWPRRHPQRQAFSVRFVAAQAPRGGSASGRQRGKSSRTGR